MELDDVRAAMRSAQTEQMLAMQQADAEREELDRCQDTISAMQQELESSVLEQQQLEQALAQEQARAFAYRSETQGLTQEHHTMHQTQVTQEQHESERAEVESERMQALASELQAVTMQRDAALAHHRAAERELDSVQRAAGAPARAARTDS